MSDLFDTHPETRRRFGFLRSVRAKLTAILLSVGLGFTLFAYLIYAMLMEIDIHMTELNDENLPDLGVSQEITLAADMAKDSMITMLVVDSPAGVEKAMQEVNAATTALATSIEHLNDEIEPQFSSGLDEVSRALSDLAQARNTAFASDDQIEARVREMQSIISELSGAMAELSDSAAEELKEGAEATDQKIDTSVKNLVDVDFQNLSLLLESRAELNLMAGASVAAGGTKDPETLSSIEKLAETSRARLLEIADLIDERAPELIDASLIRNVVFTLETVLAQSLFPSETLRKAAMKARSDTDRFITMAIDAQMFKLHAAVDKASKSNGEALELLLTNEVGFLDELIEIGIAANKFQVAALDAATSDDEASVNEAAQVMAEAGAVLAQYQDFRDARVAELLLAKRVASSAASAASMPLI